MANRFSIWNLGMFDKLKNESRNGNESQKNDRGSIAKIISWILIYDLCMLHVKWAGLYHFCGSLCPEKLELANPRSSLFPCLKVYFTYRKLKIWISPSNLTHSSANERHCLLFHFNNATLKWKSKQSFSLADGWVRLEGLIQIFSLR